jgi:hypothetical protein
MLLFFSMKCWHVVRSLGRDFNFCPLVFFFALHLVSQLSLSRTVWRLLLTGACTVLFSKLAGACTPGSCRQYHC